MNNKIILESWEGGLGNNIAQLCHAVYLAEKTHSYLEVPPHNGLLETHNLDFANSQRCREIISNRFFWLDQEIFGTKRIDWNSRRKILKRYIHTMLPERLFPIKGEDGIVIHIRSGDVFNQLKSAIRVFKMANNPLKGLVRLLKKRRQINAMFVQPPLVFYKKIIESQPWSHITIIAEDMENPVIPRLIQSYDNIEFKQRDIEDDITALLAARNLVVGYGTFGVTWALLSNHLQSLYCPVLPAKVFGKLHPGDIMDVEVNAFEFRNYIPLGQWKATAAQKAMMLTFDMKNIIAVGPSIGDRYGERGEGG